MTNDNTPQSGDLAKVLTDENDRSDSGDGWCGHQFPKGEVVRFVHDDGDSSVPVRFEYLDGHDYWFLRKHEIEWVKDPAPEGKNPYAVGQKLVVALPEYLDPGKTATAPFGVPFGTGAVVTETNGDHWVTVDLDPNTGEIEKTWRSVHTDWFAPAPEPSETETGRPTIDFGTAIRTTSRGHASDILDIVGKDLGDRVGVLQDAANGYVVDAYALNKTLTSALRAGLNRGRTAGDRRDFGSKVAHLAYITQGVLENHADNLPAYAAGVRSRKIEELTEAMEAERTLLRVAQQQIEEVRARLDESRAEVSTWESTYRDVTAGLQRQRNDAEAKVAQLDEANTAVAETLEYALGVLATLNEVAAGQVLGFMDAKDIEIKDVPA